MSRDMTLTQLLARMDAHLAEQDAYLARWDAEVRLQQAHFRAQHDSMRQTAQTLADTSRFLAETGVEASRHHATTMQALEALIARLERPGQGGDACGRG